MNQLHPNDKQNRTKHRKMLKRLAERKPNAVNHPRAGKTQETKSYRRTRNIAIQGTSANSSDPWILKAHSANRNTEWIAA